MATAYIVMAYTVTAYIVTAIIVMAYIVIACMVMAYIITAYIVVTYLVMAYWSILLALALVYVFLGCWRPCVGMHLEIRRGPAACVLT